MNADHNSEQRSRHKQLDRALTRHQGAPDALVEVLHTAQQQFGYLSKEALSYIAAQMQLPPSHVYGVASYYPFFRLTPPPEREVTICAGTACYVNGSSRLEKEIRAHCCATKDPNDTPAADIGTARCLGACGNGPIVRVNNDVLLRANVDDVNAALAQQEEDAS